MKSGARKTVALFVNRPMHDIEIMAQKQHAHNGEPGSPIEQKRHLFLESRRMPSIDENGSDRRRFEDLWIIH